MAKDSYWFRHDSTAGRGLKMRKMAHIYGHWGKGVYWDVVEILRDQSNYSFESDESSLQLLCDLIGCKDEKKFLSWFKDSFRLGLFSVNDGLFNCPPLSESMGLWEIKKENGSKGGRPRKQRAKTETITEPITETKPSNRTEQNIHTYNEKEFLSDWNILRKQHLKKPSHLNRIGGMDEKDNLNDLLKDYNRDDFKNALTGLFKQKELPNGNTSMQSNPTHFLKYFNSYLTAYHDKNTGLYGKEKQHND